MKAAALLREVELGLPSGLRDRFFGSGNPRGVHLAVMREPFLSYLLVGQKTIESRFSVNRVEPFDQVCTGDLVLLKSGSVIGAFIVDDVDFRILQTSEITIVRRELGDRIMADEAFWELKRDARFVSLLTVGDVITFPPFAVSKRDMRGWVVLRAPDRELTPLW